MKGNCLISGKHQMTRLGAHVLLAVCARAHLPGRPVCLQVRMVEYEMTFLYASIRLIPCGKYIILDFDWVADSPQVSGDE